MKNYLEKLQDAEYALNVTTGTSLKGYLHNTKYSDLIKAFGQPTFNQESGDGKVQFEWVFEFNGDIFTLYDWKTYDVEYTINELTTWNIGGKTSYVDFSNHIEELLNSKQVENA
jgi:hypothetical protein